MYDYIPGHSEIRVAGFLMVLFFFKFCISFTLVLFSSLRNLHSFLIH